MNGENHDITRMSEAEAIFQWVYNFLENNEDYPVFPSDTVPGQIFENLDPFVPESGASLEKVFEEFKDKILPGMTHWNHPGFFAYFNSSATLPAVLAEMLCAAINTNTMLWKSSPAGTEVEQKVLDWFAQMLGLEGFCGITYDGGSSSSFHALAAMREDKLGRSYREKGLIGLGGIKPVIYLTEQTHNSIHKALITLGFGTGSFRYVAVDKSFSMDVTNLKQQIAADRQKGFDPICLVATLGSTSCTAIDPVGQIAEVCGEEKLWLHVDAAHGGSAAIVPEIRQMYKGWERADSILVNPHKWLFMPIDLSVLFIQNPQALKNAFHFSAEYLKTGQDGQIDSYMDYGIPLGRRFRCLKFWFSLKCLGLDFFKQKIKGHLEMSDHVYQILAQHPEFELMAPKPLSTVCFRAIPKNGMDADQFNENLMDAVNNSGKFFISHTKLNDRFVLRHVISGLKTEHRHVTAFLETLFQLKKELDEKG